MKTIALGFLLAAVAIGCGEEGGGDMTPTPNVDTLPWPECGSPGSLARIGNGGNPSACVTTTPARPGLTGTWMHPISARSTVFLNFDPSGAYVGNIVQSVSAFDINMESEVGTFAVDGDRLIYTPIRSSCASTMPVVPRYFTQFTLAGDTLTIFYEDGLSVFERLPPTTGGGSVPTVRFGCFDRTSGAFTVAPVLDVTN